MSFIQINSVNRSISPARTNSASLYKESESVLCKRCSTYIYPLELMGPVMGYKYHKHCFRCQTCDRVLDFKTYKTNMIDLNDKHIYCINHYPRSGKYTEVVYPSRPRSKSPRDFIESADRLSNLSKQASINEILNLEYGKMHVESSEMNTKFSNKLERKNSSDCLIDSCSFDWKTLMGEKNSLELKKTNSKELLFDEEARANNLISTITHSNDGPSTVIVNSILNNNKSESNNFYTSSASSASNSISVVYENSNSNSSIRDLIEQFPVLPYRDDSVINKSHDIKIEIENSDVDGSLEHYNGRNNLENIFVDVIKHDKNANRPFLLDASHSFSNLSKMMAEVNAIGSSKIEMSTRKSSFSSTKSQSSSYSNIKNMIIEASSTSS